MPRAKVAEWVEVGCPVQETALRHVLDRLKRDEVIKVSENESVCLAIGISCQQESREDLLLLLQRLVIEEDESPIEFEDARIKREASPKRVQRLLLYDPMAERSLGDIYRHIPSPPPIEAPQPESIKTKMSNYQLRTLHSMIQREREPEEVYSGYYIPLQTASGRILYLHPSTLEVKASLSSLRSIPDARGGILSEEMGVGKTLECTALILSTRGSLPTADANEQMASSVTSALAMEWPHKDGHGLDPVPKNQLTLEKIPYYSAIVEQQSRPPHLYQSRSSSQSSPSSQRNKTLPTLKHLCAHILRLSDQSIAPEQYSEEDRFKILAMELLLQRATPFFHLWPPLRGDRTPRVEVKRLPVKVYLSTATLVVVPGTLQAQWQGEIDKHTVPGSLRVLHLLHANSIIPSAFELANNYDLILLSHSRLGKEYNEGSLEWKWPSVPRECRCPYLRSTRTVVCSCLPVQSYQPSNEMSPPLQCKFKRLCLDESHVAAGDSDMVRMANKIRSECRWVISGTPTESLVGSDLYRGNHYNDRRVGVTKTERKDLEKLQGLLGEFLSIPHLQDWHMNYENPFKKRRHLLIN